MHNSFVAEEFIKLMMLSIQGDTGFVPARNGACLCKQEFAALYTVEAVVITSSGLGRFRALLEDAAEKSRYDENNRRIMRTYVVVPVEEKEDGLYVHISGEAFTEELKATKKICENNGFLCEIAVADFINGTCRVIGGKRLGNKAVQRSIENFISENGDVSEGDEATVEEKLARQREKITAERRQVGIIREKSFFDPAIALIIINVAIFVIGFILEIKQGYDPLVQWGVQDNYLIMQGQVWRLFTSMFLHADAAHLSGNMLMLLYLGRITLRYYTNSEFFGIYFVSGLVGNILSFFFTDYLSLGASGAIMGLGGMLIYRMFAGKNAKKFRLAGNYAVMAIMVAFNLFYGLFAVGEQIDNFGHFGGFFGGFAVAWCIEKIRSRKERSAQ